MDHGEGSNADVAADGYMRMGHSAGFEILMSVLLWRRVRLIVIRTESYSGVGTVVVITSKGVKNWPAL